MITRNTGSGRSITVIDSSGRFLVFGHPEGIPANPDHYSGEIVFDHKGMMHFQPRFTPIGTDTYAVSFMKTLCDCMEVLDAILKAR